MNCVRKHLSAHQGRPAGGACAPAKVVTLLISDVPGDAPAVIASGPTVPDATTCADALAHPAALRHRRCRGGASRLESGALETPKPGDAAFAGHEVHLIATPQQSAGSRRRAGARGAASRPTSSSDEIEGESREVGKVHAALARAVRAAASRSRGPA